MPVYSSSAAKVESVVYLFLSALMTGNFLSPLLIWAARVLQCHTYKMYKRLSPAGLYVTEHCTTITARAVATRMPPKLLWASVDKAGRNPQPDLRRYYKYCCTAVL